MQNFDKNFLFGIIFDLPQSSALTVLKDSLIKHLVLDTSRMYISCPEWQIPRDQGESVFYVASYKELKSFNIETAFKSTVTIIGEQNEDCEKYVLLITDRFQAPRNHQYRKGFLANTIRGYKSKIIVFGMPNCDRLTLKSLSEDNDAQYVDLDDPFDIQLHLAKLGE